MANKKTSEKSTGTDQAKPDNPDTTEGVDTEQSTNDAPETAKDDAADRGSSDAAETGNDNTAAENDDTAAEHEAEPASASSSAPEQVDVSAPSSEEDDSPTITKPATPVTTEQVVVRKGGFFPMLLGGAAAAAIGFGVSQYMGEDWPFAGDDATPQIASLEQRLEAQNATLTSLQSRIDQAPDFSGLQTTQSDLASQLSSLDEEIAQMSTQLAALDDRLTEVEKRPVGEAASDAAVAAFERELKALQESMAQQRAEIEAMAQEARAMEQSAEETAQAIMRRAAVTRIQTALDTGSGFATALADLEAAGATVPAALRRAAGAGVPTLADLQDSFPEAARRALRVSRGAEGSDGGGVGGFLRDQLGVRSLTPKEGNDPDAVLSRAEAAIGERRLQDALAELEALPEAGRAELSDWSELAKQRLEAVSAAESLTQDMN